MFTAIQSTNDYLGETVSPVTLMTGTAALTLFTAKVLGHYCQRRWRESTPEQISRWLLKIPQIKQMYLKDIEKNLAHFKEKTRKQWENFGPSITQIPKEGWSDDELLELLRSFVISTEENLKGKHFSGTIYSNSDLSSSKIPQSLPKILSKKQGYVHGELDLELLSRRIDRITTLISENANLWNSLHTEEFGIGNFVKFQVVHMVGNMFGATDQIMGFVTNGGSRSLITAARAYRNWGVEKFGHQPGQSVILAPKTIHASLLKAGENLAINVVLVPCDEYDNVDLTQLAKLLKKHGSDVVAIYASAPSYPLGQVDPIREIGEMASQHGCGFHVDCCLGAFVINHNQGEPYSGDTANFLSFKGVTSLSADTHKNGGAPKGSSVLVTRAFEDKNLAYHAIYGMPNLRMGVYGSPNDEGSESCVPAMHAFFTMLAYGQSGYREAARLIQTRAKEIENYLLFQQGISIRILNKAQVNVIGFKLNSTFDTGATYVFAQHMKLNGIVLSTVQGDQVHLCITARFAADKEGLTKFQQAVTKSLVATKEEMNKYKREGTKLSGDAGMYCAIENAVSPSIQKLNLSTCIQNYLFGKQGAIDAVKAYFYAQMNPYDAEHLPLTREIKTAGDANSN